MKKIFLDANILIDISDDSRPSSQESATLFRYLIQNSQKFELYTSCDLNYHYLLSLEKTSWQEKIIRTTEDYESRYQGD